MLTTETKSKIITKHKLHEKDTGSVEVQSALISQEIARLLVHLKSNAKDNHSRRGLLKMVAKRRKLLKYLEREDSGRYKKLLKELNLK